MIYRDNDAEGRRRPGYVQISNAILLDDRLSAIDIVILARLLSKPNNWIANKSQIAKENGVNKETATTHIRRLAYYGYLRPCNADRDVESGRYITVEYDVIENPAMTENPSRQNDHDGFSVTAGPSRMKRDGKTANNNNIVNNTIKQQQDDGAVVVEAELDEAVQETKDRMARYNILGAAAARQIAQYDLDRINRNIDHIINVEKPRKDQIAGAIINAIKEDRAREKKASDERNATKEMNKQKERDKANTESFERIPPEQNDFLQKWLREHPDSDIMKKYLL